MQANLEQIKEMVRTLPIEDLNELEATISEEKKAKQSQNGNEEKSNWHIERYKKARKWLDENGEKYMNQWVCLEGNELIAYGKDVLEVDRIARERASNRRLFITLLKNRNFITAAVMNALKVKRLENFGLIDYEDKLFLSEYNK